MTPVTHKVILVIFILLGLIDVMYGILRNDAISLVIGPVMVLTAGYLLTGQKRKKRGNDP